MTLSLVLVVALGQLDADGGLPAVAAPPLVIGEVTPAAVEPAPHKETIRVTTTDGDTFTGQLEFRNADGSLRMVTASGIRLDLPATTIEKVEQADAALVNKDGWFEDPNRTRYLYGPSAMLLRKGEKYFAQTELLLSTFSYGITDWFTIQAGGAVPLWFVPPLPQGFNAILAAKFGGSLTENIHLAGGAQLLVIPFLGVSSGTVPVVGLAFGSFTYGNADRHVTFSAGTPFGAGITGAPIISVSANVRVAKPVAIVTENWLVLPGVTTGNVHVLLANSLAARIMTEHIAVDLGLILISENGALAVPFPIPWLQFVYNFGR